MKIETHCDICQLCIKAEQRPGSPVCKNKIIRKFYEAYWHNGIHWYLLSKGRILTKATLKHTKKGKKARNKNKNILTYIAATYNHEHDEILKEWSNDISGFQSKGHMDRFIFYMTTHPFSRILEYRLDGYLIGFSWLIIMDNTVIQQLFPWRKKRFSKLSLGAFENEILLDLWPGHMHFLGMETEFKSKFGGWAYKGPVKPEDFPAHAGNK
jgi:hypothetical protein